MLTNQSLKDRLECFDDLFPMPEEGMRQRAREQLDICLQVYHKHVRKDGEVGRAPME